MAFKHDDAIIVTKPFADNHGYYARFQGVSGVAVAGQVTPIDLVMSEQRAVNGIELILKGHVTGDSVNLQVIYSGQVVDQFGLDWYVSGDSEIQSPIILPIKASILPTMSLRVSYRSTGNEDVQVFANYHLYEE